MPAQYEVSAIGSDEIPRASDPARQHLLDVYASEINKVASVWRGFDDGVIGYRPHPKSMTVADVFRHELLSGRRFFGEFLGLPEPDAASLVPSPLTVSASVVRLAELARARLPRLAREPQSWWEAAGPVFGVGGPRLLGVLGRILDSAHHPTQ